MSRSEPKVAQILSYWARCLRHQEALAARPRARRNQGTKTTEPNLLTPVAGQDYTKLSYEKCARFLVDRGATLTVPLQAEGLGYFEHWLSEAYRGDSGNPEQLQNFVLFPSLLFPKGELAGLLRLEVELQFLDAEQKPFQTPSHAQRNKGLLPAAPTHLLLRHTSAPSEEQGPFLVNERALREICEIDEERLETFLTDLRSNPLCAPVHVLEKLEQLLMPDAGAAPSPLTPRPALTDAEALLLLERLSHAVASRLGRLNASVRPFPLALLVSASVSRITWHAQRDLEVARQQATSLGGVSDTLCSYLGAGTRYVQTARRPAIGRYSQTGLTGSQITALETALATPFCAVQGPPGTGKTTLILNAVAHAFVEHVTPLLKGGTPATGTWLITSTNNRAVDNVLGPLRAGTATHPLPLGLRIGSRMVMDKVAAQELERCKLWLSNCPTPEPAVYEQALQEFAARMAPLAGVVAHTQHEKAREELLRQMSAELSSLPQAQTTAVAQQGAVSETLQRILGASAARVAALRSKEVRALAKTVQAAGLELGRLLRLTQRAKTTARVEQQFEEFKAKHLTQLEADLETQLQLGLPPGLPQLPSTATEDWSDALDEAQRELEALEDELKELAQAGRQGNQRKKLIRDIESLKKPLDPPTIPELSEASQFAIFEAALALHHAWTVKNKEPLVKVLAQAAGLARNARSLRRLLETDAGSGAWLRRLFPVWGCTLLSLGNNFPAEPCLQRVIIDEAGQCHPAFAVSALLRARSVLFLGDVHQLEPVFELPLDDERRIAEKVWSKPVPEAVKPYRVYEGCDVSAQRLANAAVDGPRVLTDHFRCQPAIAAISDKLCNYGLTVRTPKRAFNTDVAELLGSSVVFDAVSGEQSPNLGSWANEREAQRVVAWMRRLFECGVPASELAVITPYRGQLALISRMLREAGIGYEQEHQHAEEELATASTRANRVAVGTVHRFQGGERAIVIFSTVVTRQNSLRFLDERVNLVNVAVSRAKDHLITVGHAQTLSAGTITRHLVV